MIWNEGLRCALGGRLPIPWPMLLDVPSDLPSDAVSGKSWQRASAKADVIRVDFPSAASDGRGFHHRPPAAPEGIFRAACVQSGHVIWPINMPWLVVQALTKSKFPMSSQQRQPEDQWLFRANWQEHDYQNRLRAKAS